MTKKEIVRAISEELGLTQMQTKDIVQKTFDAIVETLVTDGRIELRNFGVFEVKRRAARRARNPRTNGPVEVPEKFVVTFKPGKDMERRVQEYGRQSESGKEVSRPGVTESEPSIPRSEFPVSSLRTEFNGGSVRDRDSDSAAGNRSGLRSDGFGN